MGSRTIGGAALFGAAALLVAAAGSVGAAPLLPEASAVASAPAAGPASTLAWTPCPQGAPVEPVAVECATVPVPLHHDEPGGRQIPIALHRLVSPNHGGPGFRGSVVINPGGPGGEGLSFLTGFGATLPAAVLDAYDVVAFDPRGVGASDGLTCGVGVPFPYELDGDAVADQLAVGAALGAE